MKHFILISTIMGILIQSSVAIVCYYCIGPYDEGCDDDPWPEETNVPSINFTGSTFTCTVCFLPCFF